MSFVRRLMGRKSVNTEKIDSTFLHEEVQPLATDQTTTATTSPGQVEAPVGGAIEPVPEAGQDRQDAPQPVANNLEESSELVTEPGVRMVDQIRGLRVGYASDVGQLRDHNEDTLMAFQGVHMGDDASDPFGFFVVTDGMGGHRAGEVASSLAARMVSREVLGKVFSPLLLNETPSADMAPVTEILTNAVQRANDQVHEQVPGGGTTLTCALILGRRAYIAHVGDSRAYLLTNGGITQVTQDHSYVGRLIELGELSPEEAAAHPQRHVLYRAIGQGDNLDIDTYHQLLLPGSRLLLCSDGLSGSVSEEEIGTIVASAATPQKACQRLLAAANAAGGPDNITAVLIEAPPD